MSCDSCGHPKMANKKTTLSVYFCNQCQKVESHTALVSDKKAEKSEGPEDMLSELYWNYKAFRAFYFLASLPSWASSADSWISGCAPAASL